MRRNSNDRKKGPNPPMHVMMLLSASCHLHALILMLPSMRSHSHSPLLMLPFPCSCPNSPIPTLSSPHSSLYSHPNTPIPTPPSPHYHPKCHRFVITVSMLPLQHTKPYDVNSLLFSEAGRKKYINGEKNFKKIRGKKGLIQNHIIFTYSFSVNFFSEAGRKKDKW